MSVSTAYVPELEYDSAVSPMLLGEPDEEVTGKPVLEEFDAEALKKRVLDTLGASAWQTPQQTFGYRWRGEDTLDWGDLDDWIQIKWVRCLVERWPVEESPRFVNTCLTQYSALRDIRDTIESSRLRLLEDIYSPRDPAAVQCFLQTYPYLIEVFLEAQFCLRKHFGPDSQVALEVVSDPELEDQDELFAYILTSLPAYEALARLDRFDEEWFLDQLNRVGRGFNFNLEFV